MTNQDTKPLEQLLQEAFNRVCQEMIEREMPRMVEEFKQRLAGEVGAAAVAVFRHVGFERSGTMIHIHVELDKNKIK